jgi:hypothetical protein
MCTVMLSKFFPSGATPEQMEIIIPVNQAVSLINLKNMEIEVLNEI